MKRLWQWLAQAPNSRTLLIKAASRGFEVTAIQTEGLTGLVVAKGTGVTPDGAIVNCAVGLMNVLDKPAGSGMPL